MAKITAKYADEAVLKTQLSQALSDVASEKNEVRSLRRQLGVLKGEITRKASALAEADQDRDEMMHALAQEEERAHKAEEAAIAAAADADAARQEVMNEMEMHEEELHRVADERDAASYEMKKLEAKLARLRARKEYLLAPPPSAHLSRDEEIEISRDAERQRRFRRRAWLKTTLSMYDYDMADISAVVAEMKKTTELFGAKEMITEHVKRVRALMQQIERDHLGQSLGLFLHFEMHLTLDKISRINAAGCMRYQRSADHYVREIVTRNPFLKKDLVKMPRLAPPRQAAHSAGAAQHTTGALASLALAW